jgi:hypothetical protein
MLEAYDRHRNLEMAGRYEEIFAPEMTAVLVESGVLADENATYLMKSAEAMIWPYDDRCRLVGEDVWEYDRSVRDFIELAPEDVLTSDRSGELLDPLIKPLPALDDAVIAAAV